MNHKNTKKSQIHEKADANITCDFGDGDISRFGVANQTHVHIHTSIDYILRFSHSLFQDGDNINIQEF